MALRIPSNLKVSFFLCIHYACEYGVAAEIPEATPTDPTPNPDEIDLDDEGEGSPPEKTPVEPGEVSL